MFTWDDHKNDANKAKHGLPFDAVINFDWETAVYIQDSRNDYGEERWRSLGLLNHKVHVVVFTIRDEATRIISLRRANKREEKLYETHKKI